MNDVSMIRTRFAPSPTGHLHVGGARTALFCWAFARCHGGRFLLRIEDTDQRRSSKKASSEILEDLRWLGIDWDEGPEHDGRGGGEAGPYVQSMRLEHYGKRVEKLLDEGRAYRAFESPEELESQRDEARRAKRAWRYDRAATSLASDEVRRRLDEGCPHVVRFRVPDDTTVTVRDEVLGEVGTHTAELDDFIIRKADGWPTYHLAVVVDDAMMGVTHVIRGQEHLSNTFRHVLLQEALELDRPVYAHLPLIFNPDGSKMSKRDRDKSLRDAVAKHGLEAPPRGADDRPIVEPGAWTAWLGSRDDRLGDASAAALTEALSLQTPEIDVEDFRRAGYLPRVLLNYLALLGWSPGEDVEHFDADFLAKHFSLERVLKSPARFDRKKLLAFNLDAIQAMDGRTFRDMLHEYCTEHAHGFLDLDDSKFDLFAASNHERSKTLRDPVESCGFLLADDDAITWEETKVVRKVLLKGDPGGVAMLGEARSALAALDAWTRESIEQAISEVSQRCVGGRLGRVAQPLRIAVTGTTVSPPIHETLLLVGKASTLARIDRCLAHFGSRCDA